METPINTIPVSRLREECKYLRIEFTGKSRADLINELLSAGCETVDMRFPAKPPKIDTSDRSDDLSNVFIGNGAGLLETRSNQLHISNSSTNTPLIGGDFKQKRVTIHDVLHLDSSAVYANLPGQEGELRRQDEQLYMYRCTNIFPGWYPISFGVVKLV